MNIIIHCQLIFICSTYPTILAIDGQLTPSSEPACPGSRVIFTCLQTGTFTRWIIKLPSGSTIQTSTNALNSRLGSVLTFANDPFHFEVHIVSNNSNTLTTELQVTAVRQLNGSTVTCGGYRNDYNIMLAVQVVSICKLIHNIVNDYINCRPSSCSKWSQNNL